MKEIQLRKIIREEIKNIKEQRHTRSSVYNWLDKTEEQKWRNTYKVDAKRVAYLINNGIDSELPKSLQRRKDNYEYPRVKKLAQKYMKAHPDDFDVDVSVNVNVDDEEGI